MQKIMFLSERKRAIECKRFQSYITNALFIRNSTHFFYSVRVRQDERKKPLLGTRIFAFFYIFILYGVSPFYGLLSLCNSLCYSSFCSTCTVEYDFVFCCVFFFCSHTIFIQFCCINAHTRQLLVWRVIHTRLFRIIIITKRKQTIYIERERYEREKEKRKE